MANSPELSVRIHKRHVLHDLQRGSVVPIFLREFLCQTRRVAFVGVCPTATDLSVPIRIWPLGGTAAAEKEVVIQAVVAAPFVARVDGGAFECDDDGVVGGIGEDMASETVGLPAEGVGTIEVGGAVQPVGL